MSIIAKNTTQSDITIAGVVISAQGQYTVQPSEIYLWASSDLLVTKIGSEEIVINDGSGNLLPADGIRLVQGSYPKVVQNNPFTAKKIDGKNLFTRVHGLTASVAAGSNDITFSIPYSHAKFNALEIVNGASGESVNFKVLDDSSGTYSTVPNYQLNQFGFSVQIPDGFYKRDSSYDADLYLNMVIKLEYTAVEAKTVRINIVLHELKS